MILNKDELQQQSHKSALRHDPLISRKPKRDSLRRTESEIGKLRLLVEELYEKCSACSQPAEEWLLDHAEFIEEQALVSKRELTRDLIKDLPFLRGENDTRVYAICREFIEYTDGVLDEESFVAYIQAYQEVSVLTISEIWAIPLIMRVALIGHLSKVMDAIRDRRAVCSLVGSILEKFAETDITPEKLSMALEDAGQQMPLSGSLIVHLVKHLRERADDTATVRDWLICKLENGPESLERIVSYEVQAQAAYHTTTRNVIESLRKLSRWNWRGMFEKISVVEQTLRTESTGDYAKMDFASRNTLRLRIVQLARKLNIPENLIAAQAVSLAANCHKQFAASDTAEQTLPRQAFVAYFLLEATGIKALRKALKMCGKPRVLPAASLHRHSSEIYFGLLSVLFAAGMTGWSVWFGTSAALSPLAWFLLLVLAAFPISEWAVTIVHWLVERVKRPVPLLRYDFSQGVPPDAATMVVVPVIWSTVQEVLELADRLELHYLANRDANIHFALLGDYKDANSETTAEDAEIAETAKTCVERLNRAYPQTTFHLFQRKRLWNPSEGVWMGWERKRGKLVEFVELLRGRTDTSFDVIVSDASCWKQIRYIITLDADTRLPLESAQRMIGTLHFPYNRPRLNEKRTRVIEGFGVLQPRIGATHEAAQQSRLAALWSGEPGVDPYAFAISDPYQDNFGQGIFTGKGIFDVAVFHEVLCDRIPVNRVLSHDLLEGGFLRAGLLADIELIDNHPAKFIAKQKRQIRWVRGDWQLILWLLPKVRNRRGEALPVDLSVLTRWQIIDNLRRSLLPPMLMLAMLLALTVLPGPPLRWFALVAATWLLPVFRQLFTIKTVVWRPRNLLFACGQEFVNIMTLPFQSVLMVNAICRTLYRLLFSKRKLLEWVSSAEVDRTSSRTGGPPLLGMIGGFAVIVLFVAAAVWNGEVPAQTVAFFLSAVWIAAPFAVSWLDRPPRQKSETFADTEKAELRDLAKDIWSFYEDFVTEKDNWLPPDNVQLEPDKGVAKRTSPTNIGLYISCVLAAKDFQFIGMDGLLERLERTIDTVERMEKWNGHLYNWYDTETLRPLPPMYVSTVDSGNFITSLITVKEGLAEWLEAYGDTEHLSRQDAAGTRGESLHVAFAEELTATEPKTNEQAKVPRQWIERASRLAARMDALVHATDFRPLFNAETQLFSLGYHAQARERDGILYDLLASEARQASFIAIALGQVSVAHWQALGRTMTKAGNRPVLLSWSGTMFEYLMPWLFMRTYPKTVWSSSYQGIVKRQSEYAKERGIPFGISESGYYAFDYQMNYQYRAFGVPGLGFKRGLEEDLVAAPYAAILAMPFAKQRSMDALKEYERLGGRGKYGYYEAMDFTRERMPAGCNHMVIYSFFAHHQGMSMLALANLLMPQAMYDRFHRSKEVRAAELLLQERMPLRPRLIRQPALHRRQNPLARPANDFAGYREFTSAATALPEVCVLSNGTFTTVVTNSGSGFSRYKGIAISRWREDPVCDPWGSFVYIRDTATNHIWSPAFQPCREKARTERVQFALDRVIFLRTDDDMQTSMEICVSPEWNAEVRRISLTNTGTEPKLLEVTTFTELSLASPGADNAHPAFCKLFVQTEYDEQSGCLIAVRRKREEKDEPLWTAHALLVDGEAVGAPEYETDRAAFIGRGHRLFKPQKICARLGNSTGAVADPAFVMRRRVKIEPGEQRQLYAITAAAKSKDETVAIVRRFEYGPMVERAFQMAWNRRQIELRNLRLTNREAIDFQKLAGRALYNPPLRHEREKCILANTKGQSGLWAFGISGDKPIILVRIDDRSNLPFIAKMLAGHEYLLRLGLNIDLVIFNESADGYKQDLQEALRREAEHGVERFGAGADSVHIILAGQLAKDERTLLIASARVVLRAGGPSLAAQLRLPRRRVHDALPEKLPLAISGPKTDEAYAAGEDVAAEKPQEWQFYNGYGGFSPDGKEYRMHFTKGKCLPAPWMNVLANPEFGCLITELGTGYTWWRNSRECKLTPWSNDPVLDPPTETAFLRDEASGEVWRPAPSAAPADEPYTVVHGFGYSRFHHEKGGIKQEMTVFVPRHDPVKVIRFKLQNRTAKARRTSLTYYAEWVLGVERQTNAPYIVTAWDEAAEILTARNQYQETFRDAVAFLGIYSPASSGNAAETEQELSWTADRTEFIGRNGDPEHPAAMDRARLSGRTGPLADSCGAVQLKFTLAPAETRHVYVLLGCEHSPEAAAALAERYRDAAVCDRALSEVAAFWEHTLSQLIVTTPSRETDLLLNGWLLYQSLSCRLWARTAFYQAGGAFGFRDQLQDSLALLHTAPHIARGQILLCAAHQYEEGDVQHWWHEETGRGIRTLFSDDLLWLPYAVARYIEHTGDAEILQEKMPYLHSDPLQEGAYERYEAAQRSTSSGTLYEHCLRAIELGLQRMGEHGLPLIGSGDWNDGMNLVGVKGRGESVWLGFFFRDVLNRFADICRMRGDAEKERLLVHTAEQLATALNDHAWDGQWYRRAFTDSGKWLGSIRDDECRIDAIAQSWSVISAAAPDERARQAMESFERELVDEDLSLIRLLTPPFNQSDPSPGYIQGYPPGIRENGAQYTHGAIWGIIAWCMLGEGDKAYALFHLLNPIMHTQTEKDVRIYAGEPYVMAADVYTAEPHPGHAGWTWYTGSAGWMYQAGVEWILGIRRRGKRLYLDPCLPREWPGYAAVYRFGNTQYHIKVASATGNKHAERTMSIDGRKISFSYQERLQTSYVDLNDDGKVHHIELAW
ncbi:MAG TPA: glucoamylase family protein [Bacilli bacterium]